MNRRGFLGRLGLGAAAVAVLPQTLEGMEAPAPVAPPVLPSGRVNLIPLDIKRGYGCAMIDDGGYEARWLEPDSL